MYLRPAANSHSSWQRRDIEDIIMWIQRLLRSPGYSRSQVTSSLMQRYLPSGRNYDIAYIRRRIVEAKLDDRTFDYILGTLKMDYQAACSAAA